MPSRPRDRSTPLRALAAAALLACAPAVAAAQGAPKPAAGGDKGDDVAARLRKMEQSNREVLEQVRRLAAQNETLIKQNDTLSEQNRKLSRKYDELEKRVKDELGDEEDEGGSGTSSGSGSGSGAQGRADRRGSRGGGSGGSRGGGSGERPGNAEAPSGRGRGGAEGSQGVIGRGRAIPDAAPPRTRARVYFTKGVELTSKDDEFQLTFHDLTQLEYRGFPRADQGTLKSQFFMPRQRWYFTGRVTKGFEFYTSIDRGYGPLDLLDAFMTLSFDPRVRVRLGRMKTPFSYEYYSINEGDLIAPERSIYASNLSGNRENGAMALGNLFDDRVGYALGIFNGPRHSFEDFNSDKDLYFYLNTRPWLHSERLPALHYLNFGATINGGEESNPAQPRGFHTANDQTASTNDATVSSLSPTFLELNRNVTELGRRLKYGAHAVWFYKSLMLIGEYGGGYQGYSTDGRTWTLVPNDGWFVQAAYFLTGEQITRRVNVVDPIRPLGWHDGRFGLGAFELQGRYSTMDLGRNIFTAGFSDPNLWSNHVAAVDLGVNWYFNYYTKVQLDWQHVLYGNPVTTGVPGKFMATTNLFWMRFQIFF